MSEVFYLMTKASGAAVDHEDDLSLRVNAHFACSEFIVDLIHNLHISKQLLMVK